VRIGIIDEKHHALRGCAAGRAGTSLDCGTGVAARW
jgi:hypothetical protein